MIPSLQLNDRVMELDRAQQPRPRDIEFHGAVRTLSARPCDALSLIRRGQSRFYEHWPRLHQIQASYGVDPAVVMAIYGHETSYGAVTGGFDLLELAGDARLMRAAAATFSKPSSSPRSSWSTSAFRAGD